MQQSSQILTVFRSRLKPGVDAEYAPTAARMAELAAAMPGHLDHKTFTADDGERVTIVTFADQASHDAWRVHPEHRAAQQAGRDRFYAAYQVQVARVVRSREF